MQPELCSDCGRVIRLDETAVICAESIVCAYCDLKNRLNCPHLDFCTRCLGLITLKQTPWVIDDLIVCEACADHGADEPIAVDVAVGEIDPTAEDDIDAVYDTARALMAAWLVRTEEPALAQEAY